MNNSIKFLINSLLFALPLVLVTSCHNGGSAELNNENKYIVKQEESEHITLINSFEVPAGKLEESVEYWEACRDFLKKQPGYISTKLHQSIKSDAKFLLVNVALWKNPQTFMDASNKMRKELGVPPVEGLQPNASLYNVIRE